MRIPAVLFLYFLFFLHAQAQEKIIYGRVTESENGTPLKYAQVYVAGTYCGTATNSKGEFALNTEICIGDELIISAVPYESTVISMADYQDKPVEVSLHRKHSRKAFRPDQAQVCRIIESALKKIPENYHGRTMQATSFYRGYVKSFNNIVQLSEAVIRSNSGEKQSNIEIKDALFAEDKDHREHFWNPSMGGFYTFGWHPLPPESAPSASCFLSLHMKTPADITRFYDFYSSGVIDDGLSNLYVIDFDQKNNIRGSLLKGTLYVDSASHAIVRISYTLSPKGVRHLLPNRTAGGLWICKPPLRMDIFRENGEITYHKFGDRWHLSTHVVDTEFNASVDSTTKRDEQHYMKLHQEIVLTQLASTPQDLNQGEPIREQEITQNYIKSNFENYESSKSDWPHEITLKADTSVFSIIRALRISNQLWGRKEGRKAWEALKPSITFSSEQIKKDLTYLREMFLHLHPAFADPVKKAHFNKMIGNIERHVQRGMSEKELSRHLAPAIESIHCGHTHLLPSARLEDYNRKFGKYFPLEVIVMGRRAFLGRNVADSAKGSEILKINGTLASSILQNIRYKASTEGTSVGPKDHFIGKHFADLYLANYLQTDSFKLELRDYKTRQLNVRTIAATNFRVQEKFTTELVKKIDSIQTVIITMPEGIPPDKSDKFLDKTFLLIRDSRYSNLVIDLRDNEEFSSKSGAQLISHLSRDPVAYYERIELASADSTLFNKLFIGTKRFVQAAPSFIASIDKSDSMITFRDHPALLQQDNNTTAFNGNVYVLINGGSSPAAIDFAKIVQLRNRGIIIGSECHAAFHGNVDVGTTSILLPHSNIRVTLPLATYRTNMPINDLRVTPDHIVVYEVEDIVKNKDREMEVCRDLIVGNCCTAKSN